MEYHLLSTNLLMYMYEEISIMIKCNYSYSTHMPYIFLNALNRGPLSGEY